MANENINISSEKSLELDGVTTRLLNKRFGKPEDYIELHIYSNSEELLYSEDNFLDYKFPENIQGEFTFELNMDPVKILQDRGFS